MSSASVPAFDAKWWGKQLDPPMPITCDLEYLPGICRSCGGMTLRTFAFGVDERGAGVVWLCATCYRKRIERCL